MYAIYNKIDASYYDDNDDENNILEKVEQSMEEKMQAKALRE